MGPDQTRSEGLPALTPGDYHELRVHGVAGRAPENMLGLAAQLAATGYQGSEVADTADHPRGSTGSDTDCAVEPRPGDVSVWEPPTVEPELRAYSWSSLTSGHWYQAFYIVLLPFMIANLAGWMIVGRTPVARDRGIRWAVLLVRAVGLLVTGIFVVSMQIVVADLVVFR
jgi:hypothetical protein